ncbi:hypothetical protein [Chryseobacterium limigenitum]|uniref:hypothetical protein n=1 Tax=Chryseobacterium limigenitum TaxID=1612149 RepID=UPI000931A370|nr:hypothetical protein [Chryseobacterium limigenitum]
MEPWKIWKPQIVRELESKGIRASCPFVAKLMRERDLRSINMKSKIPLMGGSLFLESLFSAQTGNVGINTNSITKLRIGSAMLQEIKRKSQPEKLPSVYCSEEIREMEKFINKTKCVNKRN